MDHRLVPGVPDVRAPTYYTEHGTHVAGIIAGQGADAKARAAHGVAPGASVHAYRVLGPYGSGSTSTSIAAMDKAADDGMDVVNMSLGAAINDPLSPQSIAADNLVLAGLTTVIAAGNSGPKPGMRPPSSTSSGVRWNKVRAAISQLRPRFSWVSSAPLGRPVVPEV
ncbi:S8 family serine peptidase [Streptomyces sp. NPDC057287]|uniref:S8 family serine peptidase n=1 Tax=Streptomyces sp. NPDC057287 TaxID=3346086 RepID=UPI0036339000